jgi:hypothetical protein
VLVGAILAYAPRENRTRWQVLGIVAVAVVVAVATLVRIAQLA